MKTSVSSSSTEMNLLGIRPPVFNQKENSMGQYLQINENGWVEEKLELNAIVPSVVQIESFLRDKETNVINRRKTQRIDLVKKVKSITPPKK